MDDPVFLKLPISILLLLRLNHVYILPKYMPNLYCTLYSFTFEALTIK